MPDPRGLLNNRLVATSVGLFVVGIAASASFALTRAFSDGDSATADTGTQTATPAPADTWPPYPPGEGPGRGPAYVAPPGPDLTPIPGATPDTTQPWWYVPYQNAERGKPLFRGEMNGIWITDGDDGRNVCENPERTDPQKADGTNLSTLPRNLPTGVVREDQPPTFQAFWCGGRVVVSASMYSYPADEDTGMRGGEFMILRFRGEPTVNVSIAEERWQPGTIAGYPAAIAQPILPDLGLGPSAVIVWEGDVGIVTVVRGFDVPMRTILTIAEALY